MVTTKNQGDFFSRLAASQPFRLAADASRQKIKKIKKKAKHTITTRRNRGGGLESFDLPQVEKVEKKQGKALRCRALPRRTRDGPPRSTTGPAMNLFFGKQDRRVPK